MLENLNVQGWSAWWLAEISLPGGELAFQKHTSSRMHSSQLVQSRVADWLNTHTLEWQIGYTHTRMKWQIGYTHTSEKENPSSGRLDTHALG